MDTIECPHCQKQVVPKVTRGQEGMHSRICPLCGKNMEKSVLEQDISQIAIKVSPKVGLIVAGVLAALAVVVFFVVTYALK